MINENNLFKKTEEEEFAPFRPPKLIYQRVNPFQKKTLDYFKGKSSCQWLENTK